MPFPLSLLLITVLFSLPGAAAGADGVVITLAGTPKTQPIRYLDQAFSQVRVHEGLVYGSAVDFASGQEINLALDLYEPEGDQRGREIRRRVKTFWAPVAASTRTSSPS